MSVKSDEKKLEIEGMLEPIVELKHIDMCPEYGEINVSFSLTVGVQKSELLELVMALGKIGHLPWNHPEMKKCASPDASDWRWKLVLERQERQEENHEWVSLSTLTDGEVEDARIKGGETWGKITQLFAEAHESGLDRSGTENYVCEKFSEWIRARAAPKEAK